MASTSPRAYAFHFDIVVPALKSFLPSAFLEEYPEASSGILPSSEILNSAKFKPLVFSVANNFAGLNSLALEELFKSLQSISNKRLFHLIQSARGPASKALAEKLFQCAIEAGNARMIEFLLQDQWAGLDANKQIYCIEGTRYTPIQRSIHL